MEMPEPTFRLARTVAVGAIASEVDPRTSPPAAGAAGVILIETVPNIGPRGHSVYLRFLDGTTEVTTMTCGFQTWIWDAGALKWVALANETAAESSHVYETSVVGRVWVQLKNSANVGAVDTVEIWVGARDWV